MLANEKLFLCANENDFILNGYSIRRFKDVKEAEYEDGKIFEILKKEGITDELKVPDIDILDWKSVFTSLQSLNINIIVENEKADDGEISFLIGKIIKITATKVAIRHFDADGIWEDELYEIPFGKITSVSFRTRYVDVFSKYIV